MLSVVELLPQVGQLDLFFKSNLCGRFSECVQSGEYCEFSRCGESCGSDLSAGCLAEFPWCEGSGGNHA